MAHDATIQKIGMIVGEGGTTGVVFLGARGATVPIFVGPEQAQAIEQARQGVPVPRPMTHDLFVNVVNNLDGTLERVRITDLEDDTFYAKLDLTVDRGDEKTQIVHDARPSDGIALAVRVECPITIEDAVIDEAGRESEQFGSGAADFGIGDPMGSDLDVGPESEPTDTETGEESESIDLDDAVDIDIDEPRDADEEDDESGSE